MLNPHYKKDDSLDAISAAFTKNKELPSITLKEIFDEPYYGELLKNIERANWIRKVNKTQFSYFAAKISPLLSKTLSSGELLTFASATVGKKITKIDGELRWFLWKDYTLLHDSAVEKSGFDIVIDFTTEWPKEAGGTLVYADGTGNYHSIPSSPNTLTITRRKKDVQKFVQYVNHLAGKFRRIIFLGRMS